MSLSAAQSWPGWEREGGRRRGRRGRFGRGGRCAGGAEGRGGRDEWRAGGAVLTRRGRIVVSGLVGSAVLGAAGLLGACAAAAAQGAHAGASSAAACRGMTRVLVRPGDTLWSIALREQPTGDPRIVVQQIIEENALGGTVIQPGQRLWVPRG